MALLFFYIPFYTIDKIIKVCLYLQLKTFRSLFSPFVTILAQVKGDMQRNSDVRS